MATQLLEIPIVQNVEYKKNSKVQILLPRSNPIRRMNLDFQIKQKSGNNVPQGTKHEDYLNLIKQITLQAGATVLFSWSAVQKYKLDTTEHGVKPIKEANTIPGANADGTFKKFFVSHDFAFSRKNLRSLGQILLPRNYSDMKLIIEWGDITDIYTTPRDGDISEDTHCEVSLVGAYNDGSGGESLIPSEPLVIRELSSTDHPITKEYDNLSAGAREIPITPTGNTILKQLISAKENITDGNPAYKDDVVDIMKWEDVRGGRELYIQQKWDSLKAQSKTDFTLTDMLPGWLPVDWVDFRAGGLIVPATEALKLQITTKAPAANKENSIQILDRFI